jgi:uncharacterized protein (TIGR03067 family)
MSTRFALMLAVGGLITVLGSRTAAGDKDDAVKADMKLLQGVWVLQSFETNGKQTDPEQIKNIRLTIKGDRYSVDFGKKKMELTFKIDPTRKPRTMDLIMTKDDQKAVTHGIYEVSADTFKLCRGTEAAKDPPTGFSTKEGSGLAMAIYKREKK